MGSKFRDLTGQTFGHLFVLKRVEIDKPGRSLFLIRCDVKNCGKEIIRSGNLLTAKKHPMTHCGCLTVNDLTGQRFGHLLVVDRARNDEKNKVCWNCICDCGKKIVVFSYRLIDKRSPKTNCGCLSFNNFSNANKGVNNPNYKHGLTKTLKYQAEKQHKKRIKIRNINPSSNLSYAETFKIDRLKLDYCVYCGSTEKMTIDHIIPIDKGGTNDPKNLVTACLSCNASKRNSFFIDWYIKSKKITRSLIEIIADMNFDSIFHLQHYQDSMCHDYYEKNRYSVVAKILKAEKKSIRLQDRYYQSLDHYPTH